MESQGGKFRRAVQDDAVVRATVEKLFGTNPDTRAIDWGRIQQQVPHHTVKQTRERCASHGRIISRTLARFLLICFTGESPSRLNFSLHLAINTARSCLVSEPM